MKRFFEFVSASASKFWNISTNKLEIETHYGRIGTPGRTTAFPADTKDELNKLVENSMEQSRRISALGNQVDSLLSENKQLTFKVVTEKEVYIGKGRD